MERGEIWIANLNPNKRIEPGKPRAVLIFQSDILNSVEHPSAIVLPLSTQFHTSSSTRLHLSKREKLKEDSYVLVDQIRAIDNSRLNRETGRIAKVTENELKVIQEMLMPILGFMDDWI